jgi:hypothetical protein
MTKIEAVARTLCRLDGYGTDVEDKGRPMWMNYRDHARQVIEAIEGVEKEGGWCLQTSPATAQIYSLVTSPSFWSAGWSAAAFAAMRSSRVAKAA